MKATMISKETCPWCDKAKELLAKHNVELTITYIGDVQQLQQHVPGAQTVPQIFIDEQYVGGYEDLERFFLPKKKKTVFNLENKGHETGEYPLFLGEDLGFVDTINRPYPILDTLFQEQMAQIWNEFEIDISQDRLDMMNAPKDLAGAMVETILWQHLTDTVASRSITGILLDHVSNSDLEGWYNAVALFESIHARTYSHIIKQTFVDPNEALRQGYSNFQVISRSTILTKAFDNLGNLPLDAPVQTKRKYLYIALVALYMLERVNFMGSFAITFGIAELGYYQGIAQLVALIARDELLHAKGGREILKIEIAKNPVAYESIKAEIQEIFDEVLKQERAWADYLFSKYKILGVNAQKVKDYVNWRSQEVAEVLGLETDFAYIDKDPLPYMARYLDSSKVQVAAQELQLTSYLLNAVVDDVPDKDKFLEALRHEMRNSR